ncbi:MAG: Zn-dependent hydrolase [Gemmatimonadota bacterium]|nr:Zn-dependent hydrolase [Gemmatimonadota bacterium]
MSKAGAASSKTADSPIDRKLAQYTTVRLTADLDKLTASERQMIPLLIDAARSMDSIYWRQAFGHRDSLLQSIQDPGTRRYAEINYGPWDRLDGNAPFITGVGPKPSGAGFYPRDMTKEELKGKALQSQYTLVRRDSAGALIAVPYHEAYADQIRPAVAKLREAAALAEDSGLRHYLELRAKALETDEYQPSDLAWLDMKDNTIDVVIGPIETYEDQLFGYKAAHEAFVLIKDKEWSGRLARYAAMLPSLQSELPVPAAYKRERPGSDSDLNAYDAVYYAGDANAGSKTIAINLPNDEEVQLRKGTRRLQLKNAMRAKFDRILVPVAGELIAEDQRSHISFDAFFSNIMFHEVAHGLGIKKTLGGKGTVREALKEQAGALEEGKADILGLFMITRLHQRGELKDQELDDNYVTFLAGIFRSIRFGASSAHGRANAAQFSFFQDQGAFTRDSASGRYRVDFPKMRTAVDALAGQLLRFQGDGDYEGVARFMIERGKLSPVLQHDLARLGSKNIPVDVVFEQGSEVLK